MIETSLNLLGFNKKETAVYLACLKLGPAPVRKIAQISGVNRGTTYDILKILIDQGIVSYYHKNKRQYFIAEDPEKLNELVDSREQKILETRGRIQAIIPQLKSIYNNAGEKPTVKFYEGHNGAKTILSDVLDTCVRNNEKEYFVYSSSFVRNILYKLYSDYSEDRVKAGIKVKVISLGSGGEERGLDERKWLTKDESASAYNIIYSGKVAMVTINSENKPMGVIIEDKNIYLSQKKIFEFIWSKL